MKLFLTNPVAFAILGIFLLSMAGCILLLRKISKHTPDQSRSSASAGKKPILSAKKKNYLVIALFSLLCIITLVLLVNLLSVPPLPPIAEQTVYVETPIPTATPQPPKKPQNSPVSNQLLRFDELDPIIPFAGNFFINGWGDDTKFHIDDRTYSYGVGMVFSGTDAESDVSTEDTPDQIPRGDCKEFTVEYALRMNYSQLIFSIGADNSDPAHYGDENTRGIAEVVLSDKDTGSVLFDTGWVNYTYAIYEASVDLTNVDILEITYRTCGVSNLNKLKTGLRFAIVDPILVLKDDVG